MLIISLILIETRLNIIIYSLLLYLDSYSVYFAASYSYRCVLHMCLV